MTFLYSPLLWGLPLIALPVLIHLINMFRHRRIQWAPIEFLLISKKKNRTWVLIKQLILLLLRMMAVAAIVMLVAQPALQDKWSGWFDSGKTHHIILLDDSYSMSNVSGDKELFDSAKEVAHQIIVTASDRQRPQALTLARFSHLAAILTESEGLAATKDKDAKDPSAKEGETAEKGENEKKEAEKKETEKPKDPENTDPEADDAADDLDAKKADTIKKHFDFSGVDLDSNTLSKLEERLKTMEVSESDAGVKEAVHVIETLFAGDKTDEYRVIYLVTDFRKRDWEANEAIRSALQHLAGPRTRIQLIDCSSEPKANLAITQLKSVPGIIAAGVSCTVEVSVKNYGKTPVEGVTVSIEQDGITTSNETIDERIGPGEEKSKSLKVRFSTPGPHAVTAKLEVDSIRADNRRFLILDVKENEPVLIIDDSEANNAGSFLEDKADNFAGRKKNSLNLVTALAPGGVVRTGIQPRVESSSFLERGALDAFSSICFTDVMPLDKKTIERLERYVAAGGNVVFFTGPATKPAYVNDHLYRSGEGVFPVALRGAADLMADPIQKLPDLEITKHPLLSVFEGDSKLFLDMLIVNRYMSVDEKQKRELKEASSKKETKDQSGNPKDPNDPKNEVRRPPKVIASLRNGDPFIIESTFGKGRVITILSTAAPIWNNWAVDNLSYVIMLQEMQAYLCRHQNQEQDHKVGQPLKVELDAKDYKPEVSFAAPEPEGKKRLRKEERMEKVIATKTDDGRLIAQFNGTNTAGVYQIQVTKGNDEELRKTVVNVEPSEGDLKPYDTEKLETDLTGVEFHFAPSSDFDADSDDMMGDNLQNIVLILLILILLIEQVLAWSCSYHLPSREKGGDA